MPNLDFKYITDENGNEVLPITHVNGVRDSNGNTLPTLIAPAHNGFGIGTCSTSSGTALAVTLQNYELTQNGIVAVTFENDVPANATLNINGKGAKAILYKGDAIAADTIAAGDTVMFCYDGSNYVVTSLGGGGSAPNPNETVNISLTQINGDSADLIGAAVTITDDDSGDTLYTATWAGTMITTEIDVNTNYTVSVETVSGYLACADQSYQAGYQTTRNVDFQYRATGVYIEATDGTIYKRSNWSTSGKTPNSIVLLTNNQSIGISLNFQSSSSHISNNNSDLSAWFDLHPGGNGIYVDDFDGVGNTNKIKNYQISSGLYSTGYAAYDAAQFTFPDGTKGYIPAIGQMYEIFQNITEINNCLSIVNGTAFYTDNSHWQLSSTANSYSSSTFYWWIINSGMTANVGATAATYLRVIKNYT